jgi:hypothetical protein
MAETFDRIIVQVDTKSGVELVEVVRTTANIQIAVRDKQRGLGMNFSADYTDTTRDWSAREVAVDFIKCAYEMNDLEIQELSSQWVN